jgi:acylphosphatase
MTEKAEGLAITVTGKVQQVWFRNYAKQSAEVLGLSGFARNQADGSVYIEVEGPKLALQTFLGWCHQGSPEAEVETVSHTSQPVSGHTGFTTF